MKRAPFDELVEHAVRRARIEKARGSHADGHPPVRAVALSMLASLKQQLGDLDRIKRIVRLFGMVNAAPGFDRMPQVIDGASDLFFELLGAQNGPDALTAFGDATRTALCC